MTDIYSQRYRNQQTSMRSQLGLLRGSARDAYARKIQSISDKFNNEKSEAMSAYENLIKKKQEATSVLTQTGGFIEGSTLSRKILEDSISKMKKRFKVKKRKIGEPETERQEDPQFADENDLVNDYEAVDTIDPTTGRTIAFGRPSETAGEGIPSTQIETAEGLPVITPEEPVSAPAREGLPFLEPEEPEEPDLPSALQSRQFEAETTEPELPDLGFEDFGVATRTVNRFRPQEQEFDFTSGGTQDSIFAKFSEFSQRFKTLGQERGNIRVPISTDQERTLGQKLGQFFRDTKKKIQSKLDEFKSKSDPADIELPQVGDLKEQSVPTFGEQEDLLTPFDPYEYRPRPSGSLLEDTRAIIPERTGLLEPSYKLPTQPDIQPVAEPAGTQVGAPYVPPEGEQLPTIPETKLPEEPLSDLDREMLFGRNEFRGGTIERNVSQKGFELQDLSKPTGKNIDDLADELGMVRPDEDPTEGFGFGKIVPIDSRQQLLDTARTQKASLEGAAEDIGENVGKSAEDLVPTFAEGAETIGADVGESLLGGLGIEGAESAIPVVGEGLAALTGAALTIGGIVKGAVDLSNELKNPTSKIQQQENDAISRVSQNINLGGRYVAPNNVSIYNQSQHFSGF